jgi:heterodisulfide reductase subunit B
MSGSSRMTLSYFPGCSLATTARENNASLISLCAGLGIRLVELMDWNCCGSSSAHSVNRRLGERLPMRNLALAPPGRPLLVACPSCNLRLRQAQMTLLQDPDESRRYAQQFGRAVDRDLKILNLFELLEPIQWSEEVARGGRGLGGLKVAAYYGCMLARPPAMRREKNYHGLMERILSALGADPVTWGYASRCCGTFLSVARPDVVTPLVNQICAGAQQAEADCIATACAMCHLNLEIRCDLKSPLPIFHFTEMLSLAMGLPLTSPGLERHLIDPRPLLQQRALL